MTTSTINSRSESGYPSEGSFSSDSDSFSSSSSSSSDSELENGYASGRALNNATNNATRPVSFRRRMAPASGNRSDDNNNNTATTIAIQPSYSHDSRRHNHRRHHRHDGTRPCVAVSRLWRTCKRHRRTIIKQLPTLFLVFCFVFWLIVQTGNVYDSVKQSTQQRERLSLHQRRKQRKKSAPLAPSSLEQAGTFLSDALDGFIDIIKLPAKAFRQASRGEALLPGCVRSSWQALNLPNCNDIHETSLYQAFVHDNNAYVGAGYWRHVWLVHGTDNSDNNNKKKSSVGVLKMMKSEHKVEMRNFERHRRDALAMERLTSAPNIVDIYGYCGNSVLTEYVGSDLHQILYHTDDDVYDPQAIGAHQLKQEKPSIQRTEKEMLQLALGVVKGVAALHQVPGGPIVHADVADKQFLIDPTQGVVKLNDFNRCRFMGHQKEAPHQSCTFRIPSAPGRHRSPEEYEDQELTEQLDTYSMANVLYGVLTGVAPWGDLPSSQVKRAVKHGVKPPIGAPLRHPGTSTALLADLVDRAYEHDAKKRITAPAMALELEKALERLQETTTTA
ncbi:protein kinase [Seminavis robusta]|uniref:Protein kinase n=1 Tax=Seminavis robusta TaxID=568900 RepID=A0A9N8E3Y1_9STRA|nr:protein kinase [Seminavis robusta]|eukprot:Sro636_g179230.1 protein kinase (559) ;mRNA; f:13878-15554